MIFRLVLVIAFIVIAIIAVTTIVGAAKTVKHASDTGDWMPDTFQRIAYVLLIVLMFGICTGLLGAV